jgi:4'-phosphopantetheinyl transferase
MTASDRMWVTAPTHPDLPAGELHVWAANLDDPSRDVAAATHLLAIDERRRAERFHFERDARRFVIRRALLRSILGRYTGCGPAALGFEYGAHGKPSLTDDFDGLQFNLSHSSSIVVFAVVRGRSVGVDVELIREMADIDRIVSRFFSSAEAQAVRALSEPARSAAFFACWTRKEAFIKAMGRGLAYPLDDFAVSVTPSEQPRLVWVKDAPDETERWSFESFCPTSQSIGAVAVERPKLVSRFWRIPNRAATTDS